MPIRLFSFAISAVTLLIGCSDKPIDEKTLSIAYGEPLSTPASPLKVFHLGHSLVGKNIPHMIRQLADTGHEYSSQIGWGTQLQKHWEQGKQLPGFEVESTFNEIIDALSALKTTKYDALVLTESVEIRDAIKYHDSSKYLTQLAEFALSSNPTIQLYLYETWHLVNDKEGWLYRIKRDYNKYWLGEILDRSLMETNGQIPIFTIPVGQVIYALFEEIEQNGGPRDLIKPEDLLEDEIHLNDLGAYLSAIVHYAVLYKTSPVGLPHQLLLHNGERANAPSGELARLIQEVTWKVVTADFRTGITGYKTKISN